MRRGRFVRRFRPRPLHAVWALAALAVASSAPAATVCVNPGGAGGCFASVQAAIDAAAPRDIVEIAAGTYVASVVLPPRKPLTLRGAGPAVTVLDGNGALAVLTVLSPNASPIAIENLGIRNGETGIDVRSNVRLEISDCAVSDNTGGGGIRMLNPFRVTVTRCTVSGNSGGSIGGISMLSGTLTIIDSTITGNAGTAYFGVGGVDGRLGTLTVIDSTISDNASGGSAGGIRSDGKLTVMGSTISGNTSVDEGGGIYLGPIKGRVLISNSTVGGNGAGADGGGIFADSHRRLILDHATVAGNAAAGRGGGVFARTISAPKPTNLRASLIADNVAASDPDCSADRVIARDGNLIEDPTGCTIRALGTGPVLAADPLLGPLQDNGGPTETQALGGGSPATGIVTSRGACRKPDQRGVARAVPCDAGAFEAP